MGNTLSKVECQGFADTVQNIMKTGITTATRIHQILQDEHDADEKRRHRNKVLQAFK